MGHRPRRSLGQNFLVDPNTRRRIVENVSIAPDDVVVEIGPGRGALTDLLADVASELILIEVDPRLAESLSVHFAERSTVKVMQADVLKVPLGSLAPPGRLVVVGNLPYHLTTPILFHLMERPRPREIVVMIQREVGERIVAPPGNKEYGALSVGLQVMAEVDTLFVVPPSVFRPRPRVESIVLRIRPHGPPRLSEEEEVTLRRLTRAAFQWRRKQLGKLFRDHPDVCRSPEELAELVRLTGLVTSARPEALSPDQWVDLARAFESVSSTSR